MHSFRFLLSRRWVLFALVVVVLGYATWWLGEWQFGRLHDRKAENAVIRGNEDQAPAPVADVLAPGDEPSESLEWRVVSATGTYDVANTVVLRYQIRDGESGVDVVVPLVTDDGTALLVDRGWLSTGASGADRGDIPDPPSGEVTVTGYVRQSGTNSTRVDDLSTRAIGSSEIARATGLTTYGGFVDLRSESPSASSRLEPVELPELDNGPHFFYGLQWWFFGVLAVFGFFYLLWDEWRNGPREERAPKPGAKVKPPKQKSRARLQADAIRAQLEREKAEKAEKKARDEAAKKASTSS